MVFNQKEGRSIKGPFKFSSLDIYTTGFIQKLNKTESQHKKDHTNNQKIGLAVEQKLKLGKQQKGQTCYPS